jgi:heat shock protein HslJ
MKLKIILLSICFPLFLGSSCEKESNENINITNSKWMLEYIEIGNHKYEPPIDYVLEFSNDSLFFMNLSVNTAGGKYKMEEKNKITILSYSPLTEICCESDFDNKLLNNFIKVQEYNIDGKSLIFSSENLYLGFKMK